jgi:hypothetical protein
VSLKSGELKDLNLRALRYMKCGEEMAMASQEWNWLWGHLVTFAAEELERERRIAARKKKGKG